MNLQRLHLAQLQLLKNAQEQEMNVEMAHRVIAPEEYESSSASLVDSAHQRASLGLSQRDYFSTSDSQPPQAHGRFEDSTPLSEDSFHIPNGSASDAMMQAIMSMIGKNSQPGQTGNSTNNTTTTNTTANATSSSSCSSKTNTNSNNSISINNNSNITISNNNISPNPNLSISAIDNSSSLSSNGGGDLGLLSTLSFSNTSSSASNPQQLSNFSSSTPQRFNQPQQQPPPRMGSDFSTYPQFSSSASSAPPFMWINDKKEEGRIDSGGNISSSGSGNSNSGQEYANGESYFNPGIAYSKPLGGLGDSDASGRIDSKRKRTGSNTSFIESANVVEDENSRSRISGVTSLVMDRPADDSRSDYSDSDGSRGSVKSSFIQPQKPFPAYPVFPLAGSGETALARRTLPSKATPEEMEMMKNAEMFRSRVTSQMLKSMNCRGNEEQQMYQMQQQPPSTLPNAPVDSRQNNDDQKGESAPLWANTSTVTAGRDVFLRNWAASLPPRQQTSPQPAPPDQCSDADNTSAAISGTPAQPQEEAASSESTSDMIKRVGEYLEMLQHAADNAANSVSSAPVSLSGSNLNSAAHLLPAFVGHDYSNTAPLPTTGVSSDSARSKSHTTDSTSTISRSTTVSGAAIKPARSSSIQMNQPQTFNNLQSSVHARPISASSSVPKLVDSSRIMDHSSSVDYEPTPATLQSKKRDKEKNSAIPPSDTGTAINSSSSAKKYGASIIQHFVSNPSAYQRLLPHLDDWIVALDPSTKILYASPSSKNILRTEKPLINELFTSFVHPEDVPHIQAAVKEGFATGKSYTIHARIPADSETDRPLQLLELKGRPVFYDPEHDAASAAAAAAAAAGATSIAATAAVAAAAVAAASKESRGKKSDSSNSSRSSSCGSENGSNYGGNSGHTGSTLHSDSEKSLTSTSMADPVRPVPIYILQIGRSCQSKASLAADAVWASQLENLRLRQKLEEELIRQGKDVKGHPLLKDVLQSSDKNSADDAATASMDTVANFLANEEDDDDGAWATEDRDQTSPSSPNIVLSSYESGSGSGSIGGSVEVGDAPVLSADKDEVLIKKRQKSRHVPDNIFCFQCGTTSSPEWRKGPQGPKTLCNACGLAFSKKQRKAEKLKLKNLVSHEEAGLSDQQYLVSPPLPAIRASSVAVEDDASGDSMSFWRQLTGMSEDPPQDSSNGSNGVF